ncbi:dihydroorotate dehydrogenase [Caldanaerobius polysaccharolyticus]|uniref:dihydroorotate dehydrogenase n=1 Tax=Caldanaerobius polysaccharolyticus TaxID=44256 RepID=UPI00047E01B8|nr:dihydroorotate dehydrogenase [Caldanaerobius polysaccharolyticus]
MNMEVEVAGVKMKNPVTTASGTFGHGVEYARYVDLNRLGAITVKAVTLQPREGNPPPRIAETPSGILNSVGLQNPGVEAFIREELPELIKYRIPIIVNVAGNSIQEYCQVVEKLNDLPVSAFEINISCPNVKQGGMAFGLDPAVIEEITREVKERSKKAVIVKLSPNVTSIVDCALAACYGGADGLSLINTLSGMAIDAESRRPVLRNVTGGLSGPAIKPIALRMVYEVYRAVRNVPIIGMGGIMTGIDAVEFMLAGATAVAVGTANLVNPTAVIDVIDGIWDYMQRHNIKDVREIIGALEI